MDRQAGIGRSEAVRALVAAALADPEATWSLGGFGALAEFGRAADETARSIGDDGVGPSGIVTARGGIVLDTDAAVPLAYETAFAGGWSQAVALCLPRGSCLPHPAGVVLAAGFDVGAIRSQNAGDNLFDLGLAVPQGRFGLRTADPTLARRLRACVGRPAFGAGAPVLDLISNGAVDVVVSTPLGRIEVFAGASPMRPRPRGFLVPRLLALGRTHAATAPIPDGLVPVATLHPAHPCRQADGTPLSFDRARHAAFQAIHARWGRPDLVAEKARLEAGAVPEPLTATRETRSVARVVRVQAEAKAASHREPTDLDDAKSRNDTRR